MKINVLNMLIIGVCLFVSQNLFSQNVTIDYQAWNPPSPPCDVFNNAINVPATINGISGTIEHQTQIGDARYISSDQSIQLDNNYVNASSILGTKYRIAYSFKVGYRYIITVTSAELISTAGFATGPYLRLDLTNGAGGGGTACVGPGIIIQNLSGNPPARHYSSTFYQDAQFPFSTELAAAFSTLEVSSIPATNGGSNAVRIRKITIEETAPAATFTLSPNSVSVQCGSSITQTFTVTNVNNTPGVTSYEWNLGSASNGWLYNGSPAPQNISTTTNTLSLTSASCSNILNNVGVTVRINNADFQTLSSASSISLPPFSITGQSSLCSSESYSLAGSLPCGATIQWDATPSGLVTINSPNASSTTLVKNNDGLITLTATITNICGVSTTVNKTGINVGFPFFDTNTFVSAEDINITVTHPSEFIVNAYRWFKDGVFFRQTSSNLLKTTQAYECHDWTVSFVTPCGESGETVPVSVGCGQGMMVLSVSPNPTSGNLKASLFEKGKPEKKSSIKQIKIVDKSGTTKKQYSYGAGIQDPILNTSDLASDIYTITAFDGKTWTGAKFIKN